MCEEVSIWNMVGLRGYLLKLTMDRNEGLELLGKLYRQTKERKPMKNEKVIIDLLENVKLNIQYEWDPPDIGCAKSHKERVMEDINAILESLKE